jgi:predicted signal transduction protein with EAL and GGDEF domain
VTAAGDLDAFALAWARAIHGVCFVPMSPAERCALLRRLAERLDTVPLSEPFDPAAAQEVGAALVAAGYAAPEVLSSTLRVVHTRLTTELGPAGPDLAERAAEVVAGVAVGFTRALRDHTLDAQEKVRRAATVARAETERALRDSDARLRYTARHDPLTGLPNEAAFLDRLTQLLTDPPAAVRLGVCCLDVDRFGAINDSLGPPVGDRLLVAVARRISGPVAEPGDGGRGAGGTWSGPAEAGPGRAAGHLVARRSGDRFAILIENTASAEDATKVTDRVLAALVEPFQVDGHELSITASAGVVERPAAGSSSTELLRAADMALRWAKADGRGCWTLFEEQRSSHDVARHRLTAQMPTAMRRGEFQPAYQPLVDLRTGGITGFEALARWDHPEQGVLGADQFVGLAEDTGLIVPLGMRLLERACHEAAGWSAVGSRMPYVSVNLSSRQLRVPGLVGEIVEVLDRTGLPPARLQLEITESVVVGTDRQSVGALTALAGYGIRIVIDDFGTGYANFTYLYDLPVHGIKLAGDLLRDRDRGGGTGGGTGHAVLDTLVTLGRRLGLAVTAEGVETVAQVRMLRQLGCHVGQGFHFGRPVFASGVPGLLDR